jgi:hypothetical protein
MVVIMTVFARAMAGLMVIVVAMFGCRAMRMTGRMRSSYGHDRLLIIGVGVVVHCVGVVVRRVVVSGAAHDVRCPCPRRRCRTAYQYLH